MRTHAAEPKHNKNLIYEIAADNPLFLLQKESLLKLKHVFMDMKVLKASKYAENVVLVLKNTSTDRLALVSAQQLYLKDDLLKGDNVVIISSVDSKKENGFDHLVIENREEMNTPASNFTQLPPWRLAVRLRVSFAENDPGQ